MNKSLNNKKNIVLHDIFDIKGGGERLALSLADGLKADLAFGKRSPHSFDLQKLHNYAQIDLGLKIELAGLKTYNLSKIFSQKTEFLNQYQNVVYSGIICPLAIEHHQQGRNFYYCHTPPRFVYDKFDYYLQNNYWPQQMMMRLLVSWFRPKYESSVALMDVVFANSNYVKSRIKKYLNRDSIVIYPPCDVNKFNYKKDQGYYLSTARFDALKRIDIIIEAFKEMPNKKLIICSSGVEERVLKKLAGDANNIQFTGQVSDKKLVELMSECIATVYIPKDEDFGMSPVESMAAGKPVICSGHGGPTESVIDGETGCYVSETQLKQSLIECVQNLDVNKAQSMRISCQHRAQKFSEESFQNRIRHYVLN